MSSPILPLLKKLISLPTTSSNPSALQEIIKFTQTWSKDHSLLPTLQTHPTHPSLLVTLPGQKPHNFLLLAHLDVVPAKPEQFRPTQKGPRLYGRGAVDDKGPASLALVTLASLAQTPPSSRPTLRLLLTTDEETGGHHGAGRLAKHKVFAKSDLLLTLDGGTETEVVYQEKGVLHFELTSNGTPAHGAYPWKGDNALEKILTFYHHLQKHFSREPYRRADHWHATLNLSYIQGGDPTTLNRVPSSATAGFDLRFTERHTSSELIKFIRSILPPGVKFKSRTAGDAIASPPSHPLIKKYTNLLQKNLRKPIKLVSSHGASDSRHFTPLNIPHLNHCPLGGNLHADQEWVSLPSLHRLHSHLINYFQTIS